MIEVLGENYFIDLDAVEEYLEMNSPELINESGDTESKINLLKFELVKMLLDTVLTENESDFDEKLGLKAANKTSLPFKLAFNSLLNKKLINRY